VASEELQQRGYLTTGRLQGDAFGSFEHLNLGATRLDALAQAGLPVTLPTSHAYACTQYKPPKNPAALRPDAVYLQRRDHAPVPVAVQEHKKASEFSGSGGATRAAKAQEQALVCPVPEGC
jgi:hypothetical protein